MDKNYSLLIDYLPKWTKRAVIESGGRDPLGLSRVAFFLTDHLLTGIITTTDRARYYSFYSWVLWHVEKEENPQNYNAFLEAFRRREAAMGMATLASNPSSSPVGVIVLKEHLARGRQTGEFDCNFKVLPSNKLGGYGQYYNSSIHHLKLSCREENKNDRTSPGLGDELAKAFDETIGKTEYIKNRAYLRDKITQEELAELENCFSLDSIKENFAEKERDQLIEIFFSMSGDFRDEKSELRRQTLTVLLHLILEYQRNHALPNASDNYSLDQYLLYAAYYGVLWLDWEKTAPFERLQNHDVCYDLWKQFCLHQFITQALENLLCAVLEAVGTSATGLTLSETIGTVLQPTFFEILEETTGGKCSNPHDLFSALGIDAVPDETVSRKRQTEYSPDHPQSEATVLRIEGGSAAELTAKAVLLLAVLYGKWRGMYGDAVMNRVAEHAGPEVWAKPVLSFLDGWLDKKLTWEKALADLIENFTLNQHDRIMYEKRRLDSSWLRRADGRIVKEQDYRANWRASRFLNSVKIMADLKLVEIDDEKSVSIAPEGEMLLKQLKSKKPS